MHCVTHQISLDWILLLHLHLSLPLHFLAVLSAAQTCRAEAVAVLAALDLIQIVGRTHQRALNVQPLPQALAEPLHDDGVRTLEAGGAPVAVLHLEEFDILAGLGEGVEGTELGDDRLEHGDGVDVSDTHGECPWLTG